MDGSTPDGPIRDTPARCRDPTTRTRRFRRSLRRPPASGAARWTPCRRSSPRSCRSPGTSSPSTPRPDTPGPRRSPGEGLPAGRRSPRGYRRMRAHVFSDPHHRVGLGGGLAVLAVVAPGQGAQTPGFLVPWLKIPAAADALRWADAVTGLDLVRLGTEGGADEIRDTAVAQP